MTKFIKSKESISSSLLLWDERPTEVSIEETYDLKVWPVTNILNEGPINFVIPPQPKGMLSDIHICTKLKIQDKGVDFTQREYLSVVNNFANSLWGQVDVQVDDRIDLTQSMRNAYAYQTFFNHALNTESAHADYLFYNELFKMDTGLSKESEQVNRNYRYNKTSFTDEDMSDAVAAYDDARKRVVSIEANNAVTDYDRNDIYASIIKIRKMLGHTDEDIGNSDFRRWYDIFQKSWKVYTVANSASADRAEVLDYGQSITLNSKLQCPLFNTSKCLPTDMKIRISLTKNSDKFCILFYPSKSDTDLYSINIEDCYLLVTYYKPRESILQLIENRIQKEPAHYTITRPELIVKPILNAGRIIRLTDIFHDKLPSHAFFCLQKSQDFEGTFLSNPYIFIPFKKFQFYLNGKPYFTDPLELTSISRLSSETDYMYGGYGSFLRQLYETIGKDLKGDCLINSSNFHLNFMVGISFGADRSSITENHLNLQEKASTYLEIDMGINEVPEDMVLIVYALFDRQVEIDGERKVKIIE